MPTVTGEKSANRTHTFLARFLRGCGETQSVVVVGIRAHLPSNHQKHNLLSSDLLNRWTDVHKQTQKDAGKLLRWSVSLQTELEGETHD